MEKEVKVSSAEAVRRAERIIRLQTSRGMTPRAATIVVDAAMYGIGCVEGMIREKIEREKNL